MKHFIRRHTDAGVAAATALPKSVRISHQESDQSYVLPLSWRGGLVSESTWTIPKGAKLGTYTVTLLSQPKGGESWPSGDFRVEEYRVPLMRGQLKPPAGELVAPKEVPVDLSVEYLSGGGAARLPVQVRYQTSQASPVEFPEFDGYSFGLGRARESAAQPEEDEDLDLDAPAPIATSGPEDTGKARKLALSLDGAGAGHAVVHPLGRERDRLRQLRLELEYRDPNGENQTVSRTLPLYPSSRLVGVRPRAGHAPRTRSSSRWP